METHNFTVGQTVYHKDDKPACAWQDAAATRGSRTGIIQNISSDGKRIFVLWSSQYSNWYLASDLRPYVPEMYDWKPISEAKHDGKKILVLDSLDDEPYITAWTDDAYTAQCGSGGPAGWFSGRYSDKWGDNPIMDTPMMFQPLPLAPDAKQWEARNSPELSRALLVLSPYANVDDDPDEGRREAAKLIRTALGL